MVLFAAIALLAAGCTTSRQVFDHEGRQAHSISCGGAANSMESCYAKAGELCGQAGYDVLGSSRSSTPFAMSQGNYDARWGMFRGEARGNYTSNQGALVSRGLMVRCKAP